MSLLGPILAAAGTAVLQRTYLLETDTPLGIPRILAVFDAVTNENPEYSSEVAKHPVENGTEITDHIQPQNPKLKLSGLISNTPLDIQTSIGNLIAGGLNVITSSQARSNFLNSGLQQAAGVVGASLLGGGGDDPTGLIRGSAADAIARTALIDLVESKRIFDVVTKRQRYTSMVVESISFPRDSNTGAALVFEMELVSIRIVSSLQVQLKTVGDDVTASATDLVNLGAQATSGAGNGAVKAVGGSWLRSLIKGT